MHEGTLESLKSVVLTWDRDNNAEQVACKAIEQGVDPVRCAEVIANAMKIIGEKYSVGEAFLPDLIVASKVAKVALRPITEAIKQQGKSMKSLGKVVIGTVFGDLHSIGKDLVATLLFADGFEVIDLGVNVKADTFLTAVIDHKQDILALSALLTTTMMEQRKVIEGLKSAGLRDKVKVVVGGGPVNQEFADRIGSDGYGATAAIGVTVAHQLVGR